MMQKLKNALEEDGLKENDKALWNECIKTFVLGACFIFLYTTHFMYIFCHCSKIFLKKTSSMNIQ